MKFWRAFKGEINRQAYLHTGRRPWSRGYGEHRQREIQRILDHGLFNADRLPQRYGFRLDERVIEYPWLFNRLRADEGVLLDAGSVLNHRFFLERDVFRNKRVFISTLAPEPISFNALGVSYVYEDLRDSGFKNDYFDWTVSLSTLEHVGMDNTMLYTGDASKKEDAPLAYLGAVRELRRILRPGGHLYVSVPFGKAKTHGWFQIFDAPMVDALINEFAPNSFEEFHFRYLPEGWTVSTREQSAGSTYFDIHNTTTYDADFAAASRAVVCLDLLK
ncbi:MAG: methyltransferase domain-containing protein [Nitrospira sp.]|nr:methyltransferase domain-containing protein [Nitrospira sp.]